ncbi:MAG: hypothetical protein HY884_08445 [Deltaproteobacteria bacterium]|nr:hypothetical protein [Deltaproteobacteria bacterium]
MVPIFTFLIISLIYFYVKRFLRSRQRGGLLQGNAVRNKFYATAEELQNDLDNRLTYYNNERPHGGYRNMGRRPIETVGEGKNLIPKEAA